ncbi:TetR/AcrR family transcriptional regulator [Winogradskya humida]|uniref:Transcriptional regulator n=1 Tax=Winogradskya humida TaxID=113566 RepID=A0ABQ3ZIT9_9ACTN|nr:TetR/AcrR family transcriptional regulator [Actinoplanes humidus]GIE18491.1 transcriptional regulator [Actinoplanes humidus]
MPRLVDHEERRRHIAQALLGIAGAQGLEAVSLREVGQAAGVSMGTVQHYFPTKDAMLVYALQHWLALAVHEGFTARVRKRLPPGAPPAPPVILTALAAEYLPYDEPSRIDARIAAAFAARGAVDPQVAEALQPAFAGLVTTIKTVLGHTDPAQAWHFAALLDGLRTPVLLGALPYEEALSIVRRHLDATPYGAINERGLRTE